VIRALVVEEEPSAVGELSAALERHGDIELVGAVEGRGAIAAIRELRPDVVFLDVHMPGVDGLSVASGLPPRERPLIVFVAACERRATDVFAVRATDYLVKPVSGERFAASLDHVRDQLRVRAQARMYSQFRELLERASRDAPWPEGCTDTSDLQRRSVNYLVRIAVRVGHRSILVPVQDVDWIEADGTCSNLHVSVRCLVIREALDALDARLDPRSFLRLHRSSVVNVSRIVELRHPPKSALTVVLRDGTELSVSRRRRDAVLQSIGRSR
jgi:two-component system LytT family response regulator